MYLINKQICTYSPRKCQKNIAIFYEETHFESREVDKKFPQISQKELL